MFAIDMVKLELHRLFPQDGQPHDASSENAKPTYRKAYREEEVPIWPGGRSAQWE